MNEPAKRSWVGPLLIGCGIIFATWIIGGAVIFYVLWSNHLIFAPVGHKIQATVAAAPPSLPPDMKPLPDADALAKRMNRYQDIYQRVRDDALAGYLQLHPASDAFADEAHAELRLAAYLLVWGDFYGEGLWQQYDLHSMHLAAEGANFSVWYTMKFAHIFEDSVASQEEGVLQIDGEAFDFTTTPYPALFKLKIYESAIHNNISSRNTSHEPLAKSLADLPKLVDLATHAYGELIQQKWSHEFLYARGAALLQAGEDDETILQALSAGINREFATRDKDNPVAAVLAAEFDVNDAWCARGSGWANTVTSQGWKLFAERLEKANTALTSLYDTHPEEPGISRTMMTVVLGQQQARDQMELWFNRGIKTDSNIYSLYMAKRWYLLPRWYGSEKIVRDFGLECVASNDWANKIPLIYVEAIDDSGSDNPDVYAQSEIWTPLEKVFRGYLEHFPDSVTYRSRFVKCAAEGGHWDVAAEQLKILGNDWDRTIFPGDEYAQTVKLVQEHQ